MVFPVTARYLQVTRGATRWNVFGYPVHDDRDTRWPTGNQRIIDGEYTGDQTANVRWDADLVIARYTSKGEDLSRATSADSGAMWRTIQQLRYIDNQTEDVRMPLCMITEQTVGQKTIQLKLQSMERIYQDFKRPTFNLSVSAINLYGAIGGILGGRAINPAFRPMVNGQIFPASGSGGGDTGPVSVKFSSDNGDILDGLNQVAVAYGREWYIDRDGALQIRIVPTVSDAPVWDISNGPGGTILTPLDDSRSRDDLYNEVFAYNPNSGAIYAAVQDNDGAHPMMYSTASGDDYEHGFGIRTYLYSSTFLANVDQARSAGKVILAKLLGAQQSLDVDAYPNPILDPGDVILVGDSNIAKAPRVIDKVVHPLRIGDGSKPAMKITTKATEIPATDSPVPV